MGVGAGVRVGVGAAVAVGLSVARGVSVTIGVAEAVGRSVGVPVGPAEARGGAALVAGLGTVGVLVLQAVASRSAASEAVRTRFIVNLSIRCSGRAPVSAA
jgi:hypothetical protein